MSLINLRDEYITPEIDRLEQELSTLLYASLDTAVENEQIAKQQQQLLSLCALKEFISQHVHKANSSEFNRSVYDEANQLGVKVIYHERKPVIGQVAVKSTSLQEKRREKTKPESTKPQPKPKSKPTEADTDTDTVSAPKITKTAPKITKTAPKLAPKITKLAPKLKPQPQGIAKNNYLWRTDKYGKMGDNSGLNYQQTLFNVYTKTADPDDIDTVMAIFSRTAGSVADQLSNKDALERILGAPVSTEVIKLHNKLKKVVKRSE